MKVPAQIKLLSPSLYERASGWWEDVDEDMGIRFYFLFNENDLTLIVRAFCSDGEEMLVQGLQEKDGQLSFSTYCLSTRYEAWHLWRFVGDKEVEHHLTLKERWKKAPDDRYAELLQP